MGHLTSTVPSPEFHKHLFFDIDYGSPTYANVSHHENHTHIYMYNVHYTYMTDERDIYDFFMRTHI